MSQRKYFIGHRVMQKIASSKPGVTVFKYTLRPIDRVVHKLTGGRISATNVLAGLPVVTLTTIGAKSGKPRTLPLLYISDEDNPDTFALIASNWGQAKNPAWYYNLKANPRATCEIDNKVREYEAHEAEGEEYERFWNLAAGVYPGYPTYAESAGDRGIPIMVMVPVTDKPITAESVAEGEPSPVEVVEPAAEAEEPEKTEERAAELEVKAEEAPAEVKAPPKPKKRTRKTTKAKKPKKAEEPAAEPDVKAEEAPTEAEEAADDAESSDEADK